MSAQPEQLEQFPFADQAPPQGGVFLMQQHLAMAARQILRHNSGLVPEDATAVQLGQMEHLSRWHTFVLGCTDTTQGVAWRVITALPEEGRRKALDFTIYPESELQITATIWDSQGSVEAVNDLDPETHFAQILQTYNLLADFLTGAPNFIERQQRATKAQSVLAELAIRHADPATKKAKSYQERELEQARAEYNRELFTPYPLLVK